MQWLPAGTYIKYNNSQEYKIYLVRLKNLLNKLAQLDLPHADLTHANTSRRSSTHSHHTQIHPSTRAAHQPGSPINPDSPNTSTPLLLGVTGFKNRNIRHLTQDSRTANASSIFFIRKGQRFDATTFIPQAYKRGCRVFVSENAPARNLPRKNTCFITVSSLSQALSLCCKYLSIRTDLDLQIIGITGTNGKTTTAHILSHILASTTGKPCATIGTLGVQITPPKAVSFADKGPQKRKKSKQAPTHIPSNASPQIIHPSTTPEPDILWPTLAALTGAKYKTIIMEASSHGLAQGRLHAVDFFAGIFTNLSEDHLDFHKSMNLYYEAKRALFLNKDLTARTPVAFINIDCTWGERLAAECANAGVQVVAVSLSRTSLSSKNPSPLQTASSKPAALVQYLYAVDIQLSSTGSSFYICSRNLEVDINNLFISSPLIGIHNVQNLLLAFAVAQYFKIPQDKIATCIKTIPLPAGRLERVPCTVGDIYIDHAHTPHALLTCLNAARTKTHKKIALIYGITGERTQHMYKEMTRVALNADYIILTEDDAKQGSMKKVFDICEPILADSGKEFKIIQSRWKALAEGVLLAQKGYFLIVAGKGHEKSIILKDLGIVPIDEKALIQMAQKGLDIEHLDPRYNLNSHDLCPTQKAAQNLPK